jgi:hypothetical protein
VVRTSTAAETDFSPGLAATSCTRWMRRDTIACGAGRDLVYAERVDRIAHDCERIRRSGRRT